MFRVQPDNQPGADWLESWLAGPLLDVGAGARRDALHFQTAFETVALEISEHLVDLLRARGVERVEHGDMFRLTDSFEWGRFRSVLVAGTQLGLAGSLTGVRELLASYGRS